jgi:hypothetical protein
MNDVISQILVERSLLIEVPLVNIGLGATLNFGINQTLNKDNARVYGIEVVTATQLTRSPTDRPLIAQALAAQFTLTLVEKKGSLEFVQKMPLTRYLPNLYNGYTQALKQRNLDLNRSNITINDVAGLSNATSVCFNIYYCLYGEK